MVSAGVANDGVLMKPNLVDQVIAPDLRVLQSYEPTIYSRPLSSRVAQEMTRMMVLNVSQGVAGAAGIPGISVAGKTGTAETGIGDGRSFWFTGFAPAENPEIVIAVVIEGTSAEGTANSVASPVAKTIMEAVISR
jgi:peptidoglycan glycosyltransferase